MKNLGNTLKRFFSNKNTVTIIGVILGVIVIYIGYNWRVKSAINPVSVPYAKVEIGSRSRIEENMIGYMQVPQSMVSASSNMITVASQIIGQYAGYGTTIPQNSLFYTGAVMSSDEMPDSAFADIKDGETIFSLPVDLSLTYGNSIFPGNRIDLYFHARDDLQNIIYGKLIESIEVLAVKDSQGRHVFETTTEDRIPSELLFAVPDDMYLLLQKALYITSSGVQIRPIPRNQKYTAEAGSTQVTSEYIRDFILSKTVILPENQ